MAQVVHHFDDATGQALVRRAARALRPGGSLVIVEVIRDPGRAADGQLAGLLDGGWQRGAGLVLQRPIRFRRLPGFTAQVATKPFASLVENGCPA